LIIINFSMIIIWYFYVNFRFLFNKNVTSYYYVQYLTVYFIINLIFITINKLSLSFLFLTDLFFNLITISHLINIYYNDIYHQIHSSTLIYLNEVILFIIIYVHSISTLILTSILSFLSSLHIPIFIFVIILL
jgi:hypothetical protein